MPPPAYHKPEPKEPTLIKTQPSASSATGSDFVWDTNSNDLLQKVKAVDIIGGESVVLFSFSEASEMDFAEQYNQDVFHSYTPKKVTIGNRHPDPVVETAY